MVLWYSVEALAAFHGLRLLVARVESGMPVTHVAKARSPERHRRSSRQSRRCASGYVADRTGSDPSSCSPPEPSTGS